PALPTAAPACALCETAPLLGVELEAGQVDADVVLPAVVVEIPKHHDSNGQDGNEDVTGVAHGGALSPATLRSHRSEARPPVNVRRLTRQAVYAHQPQPA